MSPAYRRLLHFFALSLAAAPLLGAGDAAGETYDLWIRNGTVIDGSGQGRIRADVLVRGDTIAIVGSVAGQKITARRTLDASGKLVTPGFIDTHAHGDPLTQSFSNFLEQGITTVVLGQDGATVDLSDDDATSLVDWMKKLEQHGSEVNVATLSGHGTLRIRAGVGNAPQPTAAQLSTMQDLLRKDLAAGAYGLSFGLEYAPGRYSPVAEQKALGDLVGEQGGIVMSHMRSEDFDKIASAVDELLQINAHVHVSHIKIVAGKRMEEAQAVLDQLAHARAQGKTVTADVYPYLASGSNLVFLYPDWAKSRDEYEKAVRERRPELEAHIRKRVQERNGPEAILFTEGAHAGKTLAQIAKEAGKPYEKAAIDIIGYGGPAQAHFLMAPAVHAAFIQADYVNICTDGAPQSSHPRSYDSFVKVLEDFASGPSPKMSFERAIYKMTGLPAETLGLNRGVLSAGRKADILVLTPDRLHVRSSWTQPQLAPTGIDYIVVNGAVAYSQGKVDTARHGAVLRRAVK
jgi:N-acyl-D-amino-acid deacylase